MCFDVGLQFFYTNVKILPITQHFFYFYPDEFLDIPRTNMELCLPEHLEDILVGTGELCYMVHNNS